MSGSSSAFMAGTRPKIFDDKSGVVIKSHLIESESNAEVIAAKISKQLGFNYLDYWLEDGKAVSRNFRAGFKEITAGKIIDMFKAQKRDTYMSKNFKGFAIKMIDEMYKFFEQDGLRDDYFSFLQIFIIDTIIVNTDRHLGNITFLYRRDRSNGYKLSPIFDCGISLNVGKTGAERLTFDKGKTLEPFIFTLGELERALGIADYFKKIDVEQLKRDVGDEVANSLEMDAFLARYTEFVPKSFSFRGFDNLTNISKKITKGDK